MLEKESAAKKSVKDAEASLSAVVAAKYPRLNEDEVKTLVVEDKWLVRVEAEVRGELARISQTLTSRIRELAGRYEITAPQVAVEVELLGARVEQHLLKMGVTLT